jgi:hypothetical protein
MQKLIVGVTTLVAVVFGFVLLTSLDSPAQETPDNDGSGDTTTTTVLEDGVPFGERFGLGFRGDLSSEVEEFLACLEERGIEVPDDLGRGFFFQLRSDEIEGLAEALETCEFPGLRFGGGSLDGEFPEGLPFHRLPEDFELPEGFPFSEDFEFHGPRRLDRDALAECLIESGPLSSSEEVRARLDECLPEEPDASFRHGPHHFGFDFDGFFDFDLDEPDEESSSV